MYLALCIVLRVIISEGSSCICIWCHDIFQFDEFCSWTPAIVNIPEYWSIGVFGRYEATNGGDPPLWREVHESSWQDK